MNLEKIKDFDEFYENCEKVCAGCPFSNDLDACEKCPVFLMMDEIVNRVGITLPF